MPLNKKGKKNNEVDGEDLWQRCQGCLLRF